MSFINFEGGVGHNIKKISFKPSMISSNHSDGKSMDESGEDINFNNNKRLLNEQNEILEGFSKKDNFFNKETFNYKIFGVVKIYSDNLNSSEFDLKKVTIELYTAKDLDKPISSIEVNDNGEFKFENLEGKLYFIRIVVPQGYNLLSKGLLSDISNKTFLSDEIDVSNSDVELKIGLTNSFEISGVVYFDQSNVGIYRYKSTNRNEGINNVLVELFDEQDNLIATFLTISSSLTDGYFSFENIPKGKYKLVFVRPEGLNNSRQIKKNKFSSMVDPETSSLDLVISESSINNIFVGLTKTRKK